MDVDRSLRKASKVLGDDFDEETIKEESSKPAKKKMRLGANVKFDRVMSVVSKAFEMG